MLPVDLLYFDLTLQRNGNVLITWATTSELNNKGFEIRRKREGNATDEAVFWIQGMGTSGQIQKYFYEDTDLTPGTTYIYQLIQFDQDLTEHRLGIKAIAIFVAEFIVSEVYPNPSSGNARITIDALRPVNAFIEIDDLTGKKILELTYPLTGGMNLVEIPLSRIASGVYMCTIRCNTEKFVRRMAVNI